MTATEEEAPAAVAEDVPDPVTGLTAADEAEIMVAQALVFRVCHNAAVRLLAAQRPALEQRVTDAEKAEHEARVRLEGPQAIVDALQAELAECEALADQARLAAESESLKARLKARSEKVAIEQEAEELRERVRKALKITDPLSVALVGAERETTAARADLADLDEAVKFPFAHRRGMVTAPYARYMLDTGNWYRHLDGPDARTILRGALQLSGMGAEIETNAIRAYASGDPAAVAAGGGTKRWKDGTTLHYTPGSVPVVTQGEATYADFATVPAVPAAAPTGAEVMAGVRTGAGWPA